MKNKIVDLNNYLFEMLERVNDDELTGEELDTTLKKAKAICNISSQILNGAKIAVEAAKVQIEYGDSRQGMLLIDQVTGQNGQK